MQADQAMLRRHVGIYFYRVWLWVVTLIVTRNVWEAELEEVSHG